MQLIFAFDGGKLSVVMTIWGPLDNQANIMLQFLLGDWYYVEEQGYCNITGQRRAWKEFGGISWVILLSYKYAHR